MRERREWRRAEITVEGSEERTEERTEIAEATA
jgi:hypothetical protein